MAYLCGGENLCTLFMHRFLETPMNKGFSEFSKNYEFEPISAITVPSFMACILL